MDLKLAQVRNYIIEKIVFFAVQENIQNISVFKMTRKCLFDNFQIIYLIKNDTKINKIQFN